MYQFSNNWFEAHKPSWKKLLEYSQPKNILEIGGSRNIAEAYKAFRGRAPSSHALLKQAGIEPEAA